MINRQAPVLWILFIGMIALFLMSGCLIHKHPPRPPHHPVHLQSGHQKRMPPGQEKKLHGSQSARPYAPGQQKK